MDVYMPSGKPYPSVGPGFAAVPVQDPLASNDQAEEWQLSCGFGFLASKTPPKLMSAPSGSQIVDA